MNLTIDWAEDGIVTIRFSGRMDLAGTQEIDQRLTGATATKALKIAFDLSGLTFIASIGIRSFFMAARAQAQRGGKIVIFGAQDNVRQVLVLSGVERLLPIYDDAESARAALAG
jgi:anti-anti-sigma factor